MAEITQRQVVPGPGGSYELYGGSTVIIGPEGEIRYVVPTRAAKNERLEEQRSFLTDYGAAFWREVGATLRPRAGLLRLVHGGRQAA